LVDAVASDEAAHVRPGALGATLAVREKQLARNVGLVVMGILAREVQALVAERPGIGIEISEREVKPVGGPARHDP
jgi:hypothetical protein